MNIQWHQGISGAFDLADQSVYFFGMQQQFAGASGIRQNMSGRGLQRADMTAGDENLAFAYHYISFLDLAAAGAYGLDLPTLERDPRFVLLFNEIIVERLFILDDAHEKRRLLKSGDSISFSTAMAEVKRSVLVEYTPQQMFSLVDRAEEYPEFLPWCTGVSVGERNKKLTLATIYFKYGYLKHNFTTENTKHAPHLIEIHLVSGPFRYLEGSWRFTELGESGCKVEFQLRYEFSSKLLEKLLARVFKHVADSFIDGFVKRAKTIYG